MRSFRRNQPLVLIGPTQSLRRRSRAYGALAALFRWPSDPVCVLIDNAVTAPCNWAGTTLVEPPELREAVARARSTCSKDVNARSLRTEQVRLFGRMDFWALTDVISPCESTYVSSGAHADREELEGIYRELGFSASEASKGQPCCAGHIATELAFMAHALDLHASGNVRAGQIADAFLRNHLSRWGLLFAAALQDLSEHDVMRFAALALEEFLRSEVTRADTENSGVHL